jgi:hypothetical protein
MEVEVSESNFDVLYVDENPLTKSNECLRGSDV